MTRRTALGWVFGAGLVAGCSPLRTLDRLTPDGDYRIEADHAYGAASRQRLDVYLPAAPPAGPRPVAVFLYGGGWRNGSKELYRFVGEWLTAQGYIAVVADYRLYPAVTFPAFVEDGAGAVAWAHAHAARFGGDPGRLFVIGHSAGAHTAVLLALEPRYLGALGLAPTSLAGVIGVSGPYDLEPDRVRWLRAIFAAAARPEDVRPLALARADAPKLLLLNGRDDGLVAPENAERLAARQRALGARAEARIYPGLGHMDIMLGFSTSLGAGLPVGADVTTFVAGA